MVGYMLGSLISHFDTYFNGITVGTDACINAVAFSVFASEL